MVGGWPTSLPTDGSNDGTNGVLTASSDFAANYLKGLLTGRRWLCSHSRLREEQLEDEYPGTAHCPLQPM